MVLDRMPMRYGAGFPRQTRTYLVQPRVDSRVMPKRVFQQSSLVTYRTAASRSKATAYRQPIKYTYWVCSDGDIHSLSRRIRLFLWADFWFYNSFRVTLLGLKLTSEVQICFTISANRFTRRVSTLNLYHSRSVVLMSKGLVVRSSTIFERGPDINESKQASANEGGTQMRVK